MRAFYRTLLVGAGVIGASAVLVAPAVASDPEPAHPAAPPGMARMHELMMAGNPGMERMHELMMRDAPSPDRGSR